MNHAAHRSAKLFAFLTVAIDLLGFGILIPLLAPYGKYYMGESPLRGVMIGLLVSIFSLMQFLVAPWWGRLSDRIGRRPVLLMGLITSALFYLLFAVGIHWNWLWLLFVARIGQGIGGATISTAQAIIADTTPPEGRARGMGLIGMAFGIGFAFGPLIGLFAVTNDPNEPPSVVPTLLAAGISFTAFVFAFLMLPETRPIGEQTRMERKSLGNFFTMLSHAKLGVPLLMFFTSSFAFALMEGTVSLLAKDLFQFGDRGLFLVFLVIGLLVFFAHGGVRAVLKHVGELPVARFGMGMMLLGMLGTAVAASFSWVPLAYAMMPLCVLGFSALTPSTQAMVSKSAGAEEQGEVLGISQSGSALARILGPFLGNVLYDLPGFNSKALPYVLSAALLAVALWYTVKYQRQISS